MEETTVEVTTVIYNIANDELTGILTYVESIHSYMLFLFIVLIGYMLYRFIVGFTGT